MRKRITSDQRLRDEDYIWITKADNENNERWAVSKILERKTEDGLTGAQRVGVASSPLQGRTNCVRVGAGLLGSAQLDDQRLSECGHKHLLGEAQHSLFNEEGLPIAEEGSDTCQLA